MELRPVVWPDPSTPMPAVLVGLSWDDPPTTRAGATPPDDDVGTLVLSAPAALTCFGARVTRIELGLVLGRLESVRLLLAPPIEAAALRSAGLAPIDDHFWVRADELARVEVDTLDHHVTLSEPA